MRKLDELILREYLRLEEAQRERLRMERLLHPEKMKWVKKGSPPPMTETKSVRLQVLADMGRDEVYYQAMVQAEKDAKEAMAELVSHHPLWEHFQKLPKGLFGPYLAAAYIAAVGDIDRCSTVSSFWSGMGLGMNDDGTVPRRTRGKKGDGEKTIPALPHVTRIGEQIRQQILKRGGPLKEMYDQEKAKYMERYPDRPKMFNHKAALRNTQKILYSVLWKAHREAYGLEAPAPYAFAILNHPEGHMYTVEDFYTQD